MTSLRARLILAFAAVAVVPLVIAVAWLDLRLQASVRADAEARLRAALALVETRIADERSGIAERVTTLAADPELRRLYLLGDRTRDELREYLQRELPLVGLDELFVEDRGGTRIRVAGWMGPGGVRDLRSWVMEKQASIRFADEAVGSAGGGVLLDERLMARLAAGSGVELMARRLDGSWIAATTGDVRNFARDDTAGRIVRGGSSWLARSREVVIDSMTTARITAYAPTWAADAAIASLNRTAFVLGVAGVALAILLGWFWSRRISLPVERLAAFSERIARGEWDEPLAGGGTGEVRTLVTSLERMRRELGDYRERLRAGERQAAYGRMAREVAHEIRNPLTPIAVSVADLRRTWELQRPELPQVLDETTRVIDQEVQRLKRLLESFATLGRIPEPRFAPADLGALVRELAPLYAADATAGRIAFTSAGGALPVRADADQLRQALLNLVKNALEAVPANGPVEVHATRNGEAAEVAVADHGPGLTDEQRTRLFVPGYTTKAHGSGIGLATVDRIVAGHGGRLFVDSTPGRGTTFRIRLPLSTGDSPWPRS